jgi:hypothetical protein
VKKASVLRSADKRRLLSIGINLISDASFIAAALLVEHGITYLSIEINSLLLFALYYVIIYFYRYIYIHRIGSKGAPVHVQMGLHPPKRVKEIMSGIFAVVFVVFPLLLYALSFLIAVPLFNPDILLILPALIFIPVFASLFYTYWLIYLNSRPHAESLQEQNIDEYDTNFLRKIFFHKPGKLYRGFLELFLSPYYQSLL